MKSKILPSSGYLSPLLSYWAMLVVYLCMLGWFYIKGYYTGASTFCSWAVFVPVGFYFAKTANALLLRPRLSFWLTAFFVFAMSYESLNNTSGRGWMMCAATIFFLWTIVNSYQGHSKLSLAFAGVWSGVCVFIEPLMTVPVVIFGAYLLLAWLTGSAWRGRYMKIGLGILVALIATSGVMLNRNYSQTVVNRYALLRNFDLMQAGDLGQVRQPEILLTDVPELDLHDREDWRNARLRYYPAEFPFDPDIYGEVDRILDHQLSEDEFHEAVNAQYFKKFTTPFKVAMFNNFFVPNYVLWRIPQYCKDTSDLNSLVPSITMGLWVMVIAALVMGYIMINTRRILVKPLILLFFCLGSYFEITWSFPCKLTQHIYPAVPVLLLIFGWLITHLELVKK